MAECIMFQFISKVCAETVVHAHSRVEFGSPFRKSSVLCQEFIVLFTFKHSFNKALSKLGENYSVCSNITKVKYTHKFSICPLSVPE